MGTKPQLIRPDDLRQFEINEPPQSAKSAVPARLRPHHTPSASSPMVSSGTAKADMTAFRERAAEKDDYSDLVGQPTSGASCRWPRQAGSVQQELSEVLGCTVCSCATWPGRKPGTIKLHVQQVRARRWHLNNLSDRY